MKKWVFAGIGIIIVIMASFSIVYFKAVNPLDSAEEKALAAVKKKIKLTEIQDVQIYNGTETYYVVKGKDQKNQQVIAWVSEKKGDVVVRKAKDGVTQQQAVDKLLQEENPKEIISVKLGMIKKRQCWEIYYLSHNNLINYYYVDFESGDMLRKIKNM